jgi:hypothetical protein
VRLDQAFVAGVIRDLEGRGAWSEELRPAVERYAHAVGLARAAWRKVPASLVTVGSMGQDVAHPLIAVALNAEKAAATFAADLGIAAPKTAKLGRPKSADKSADVRPGPKRLEVVAG